MKLTVSKYLNARKGAPSVQSHRPYFREPGTLLEMDRVLTGEMLDGNPVWLHCSDDDCFYWSGGISEVEFKHPDFTLNNLDEKATLLILASAVKYFWNKWKNQIAGLTGVYVGDKHAQRVNTGITSIVFQVNSKHTSIRGAREKVPEVVFYMGLEIKTDVEEASVAAFEIISPGDSISRIKEKKNWGSVGLKVFRKEGNYLNHYLLTNYHVGACDLLKNKAYQFSYPLQDVQNRQVMVPCQEMSKGFDYVGALKLGYFSAYYDIALILLNNEQQASNNIGNLTISGYEDVTLNPGFYKGKNVSICGAASGRRKSEIVSVFSNQFFTGLDDINHEMLDLIQINKCSGPGDSGSPIIIGNKIIGIHIGADSLYSYSIPIKRILDLYNLKISNL